MKLLHLSIIGHDLLAVERFRDSTRHLIEFLVLAEGKPLPMRGRATFKSAGTPASLRATSCPTSRESGAKTDRR